MKYFAGNELVKIPAGWYLTAEEAMTYLNVSREQFYSTIWDTLTKYHLPDSRYGLFYRLSDLDKIKYR